MKRDQVPILILAVVLFLAPIIGGQLSVDASTLGPGFGNLMAALGGNGDLGILPHALLAAGIVLAASVLLLSRQIIQTPNQRLGIILVLMLAVIGGSVAESAFKGVSVVAAAEWWAYGIAFFAAVACSGRQLGPKVLISALFAGAVVVAIKGILEYGQMKTIDPTWRIFAGWVNPNATAAILLVGFFLGIGLLLVLPRLAGLLSGLGTSLIGLALALTQSKGGLLAWGITCVFLIILLAVWIPRGEKIKSLTRVGAVMGLSVLLVFAIVFRPSPALAAVTTGSPPSPVTTSALSRLTNSGGSQDQSSGFRSLLWKGCIQLVKENPIGYGIGAYRFESARTGLTTQTQLAHETYLQLMVEASPLATGLLFLFSGYWLWLVLRGARKMPTEANLLRAGVISAVLAVSLHNFVDSDHYYFGIGLCIFSLMGIGLVLSSDSVTPEFVLKPARIGSVVLGSLVTFTLFWFGYAELLRAEVRFSIGQLNSAQGGEAASSAEGELDQLLALFPNDAEGNYLAAKMGRNTEDRQRYLRRAVENGPSTRNLRALARELRADNKAISAESYLQQALKSDPNNLLTLTELLQLNQSTGNQTAALATANRLIDVEKTPYFQIRSLPNLVPTETYLARVPLAAAEPDPIKKSKLLREAVDGLKNYLRTTVPEIKQAMLAPASSGGNFGGENPRRGAEIMVIAEGLSKQLALLYRTVEPSGVAAAEANALAFAAAAADLRK